MNRGSDDPSQVSHRGDIRFNEAPIHESGKYQQFERDRFRAGQASMRPRFMNRGSDSGKSSLDGEGRASMRPRFMNRGSPAARPGA